MERPSEADEHKVLEVLNRETTLLVKSNYMHEAGYALQSTVSPVRPAVDERVVSNVSWLPNVIVWNSITFRATTFDMMWYWIRSAFSIRIIYGRCLVSDRHSTHGTGVLRTAFFWLPEIFACVTRSRDL